VRISRFFSVLALVLCLLIPGLQAEIEYPWKNVYIGALDARAWNGLVISPNGSSVFAFRIKIEKDGEIVDGSDISYLISEVGPHSPDGQYARIKLDMSLPLNRGTETPVLIKPPSDSQTFIFEWSRQEEKTVIGRIRAPEGIILHLTHYFPWDFKGSYRLLPDGQIKGESSGLDRYNYLCWTDPKGSLAEETRPENLTLSFFAEKERSVYFVVGIGEDEESINSQIYRYKDRKTIDSLLEEEEKRYRSKRVRVEGLYQGAERAVANNVFWTSLYQPGLHRIYVPPGRTRILPTPEGNPGHWTIYEWVSFLNALEAVIES
jgi:hypothetical protein